MNVETHRLAGAYAVDALDDAERAAFEEHLRSCADCREEVTGLQLAAGELAHLTSIEPPAHLKDSVMASIRSTRPLPPLPDHTAEPDDSTDAEVIRPRQWTRPAVWLAAAAAAAAVVIGGLVWGPLTEDPAPPTVAERVLAAGDAREVTQRVDGATVTVVVSRSVGETVVVTDDMPAPPVGKDYQLWIQRPDGTMAPAGLMPEGAGEHAEVVLKGDTMMAIGVGITVEPEGGSPQPTTKPVALLALPA